MVENLKPPSSARSHSLELAIERPKGMSQTPVTTTCCGWLLVETPRSDKAKGGTMPAAQLPR